MTRLSAFLLTLAVLAASSQAQVITTDAATAPEVTYIQQLITGAGLTPDGTIPSATYNLPDNDAVTKLLQSFGVTFDQAVAALGASILPATIENRLNSIILYHIIPSGVLTPAELGEEGTVPTALPGATLQFSANGTYITTPTGSANVLASGETDGSSYLILDAALLPAEFSSVVETSTEDALAILAAIGGAPAPTAEE